MKNNENFSVTERFFPGVQAINPDLASLGVEFARSRCIFCEKNNKCSVEAKTDMMSTDHCGSAQKYCSGFELSLPMCRRAIFMFLESNPDIFESIVNIDPDTDPFADLAPGESVF